MNQTLDFFQHTRSSYNLKALNRLVQYVALQKARLRCRRRQVLAPNTARRVTPTRIYCERVFNERHNMRTYFNESFFNFTTLMGNFRCVIVKFL